MSTSIALMFFSSSLKEVISPVVELSIDEGAKDSKSDCEESEESESELLKTICLFDLCLSMAFALWTTSGDMLAFLLRISRTLQMDVLAEWEKKDLSRFLNYPGNNDWRFQNFVHNSLGFFYSISRIRS